MVTELITLISSLFVPHEALLHAEDTDFYIFNSGSDSARDVVDKTQMLLNA